MRGTSGASLAQAQARFEPVLAAAGDKAVELANELFAVAAALDGSASLRRSMSDPSRSETDKAALAGAVLQGFDPRVVELVSTLASSRWAHDGDIADAVEELGVDAALASAQARGALEKVEDEIFQLTRALVGSREARQILSDSSTAPERRRAFVAALLAGKADAVTTVLAEQATVALRGRRFVPTLGWYGDLAAQRRQRLVASVTSAVDLDKSRRKRLGELLEQAYGRAVQLNVTVDPQVIGGLRVQVGSDVVNSTVLSRLADARRRLAS